MHYRCKVCDASVDLGAKRCPNCKDLNPYLNFKSDESKPAAKPLPSKAHGPLAARDSRASESDTPFPDRIQGTFQVVNGRKLLKTEVCTWQIEIVGNFTEYALHGLRLDWQRVGMAGALITVTPIATDSLRRRQQEVNKWLSRIRGRPISITPKGATTIERESSLQAKLRRLAEVSKTGFACDWAEVASCWQDEVLRKPVVAALKEVGWDKIHWLLHATPGWPDDLRALVAHERAMMRRTIRKHRDWDSDDYLLGDT